MNRTVISPAYTAYTAHNISLMVDLLKNMSALTTHKICVYCAAKEVNDRSYTAAKRYTHSVF